MKISVKNLAGKKVEDLQLSEKVFGQKVNPILVKQIFDSMASNRRANTAHTKERGEITGSNAKPWRQKGTGRARTGDRKNPIWRGGGTVFGPRNERNYEKKINRKMKIKALLMVLSGKVKDQELVVVDSLELKEKKTKKFAEALKKLKVDRKVLAVFSPQERPSRRCSRNIPGVKNLIVENLNVWDMLNSKYLLLSKKSIEELEKRYG